MSATTASTLARAASVEDVQRLGSLVAHVDGRTLALFAHGGAVFAGADPVEPFTVGLDFGVRYRARGFGQGLTMHACFANLLPVLDPADRSHALYHGLAAVAADSAEMAPRFQVRPLPGGETDPP